MLKKFILFTFLISFNLAQERCDNGQRCGPEAPCCSQFGYCGSTWEYCAAGCNHALSFNPSSCFSSPLIPYNPPHNPPHNPPQYLPEVKRCSKDSPCPADAPCCSQFGYCGSGPDYCHAGCNAHGSYSPLSCGNHHPSIPVYPVNNNPHPYPSQQELHYPPLDNFPNENLNEWNSPSLNHEWSLQNCRPWKEQFSPEISSGFRGAFIYGGPVSWDMRSLSLRMMRGREVSSNGVVAGIGGWARTKRFFHYGKFTARIKAARVGGVVSAFNLISKDGDEIDFEWVGHKEDVVQTNYYYKGILDYSKGQFSQCNINTHYNYLTYSIHWAYDSISYFINNQLIRKVTKESTYNPATQSFNFPSSPVQVQFMLWDGGAGSPGTREWAGGYINWNDSEIISNGGFIDMHVDSFTYECY